MYLETAEYRYEGTTTTLPGRDQPVWCSKKNERWDAEKVERYKAKLKEPIGIRLSKGTKRCARESAFLQS